MLRLRGVFVALVLIGLGVASAGCGKKSTLVEVTIEPGSLDVNGVTRVDLNLTFGGSQMATVTLGGGDGGAELAFPQTARLEIGSNQGGDLIVEAVAVNGAGQRLQGTSEVNVAAGTTTRVTVTFGQTSGPDAGACTMGQVRCQSDGKTPEKCVDGSWQPQAACPNACANGACSTCVPNAMRCGPSGVPQKCKADGSGYADQPACPAAMPICDPTNGTCTVGCTPNDKRCSPIAPVIQQCDLQAIWRDTTTCPYVCAGSGATTACGGSCQPQTRSCGDNQTPYLCDATGTSQPQTACTNVCTGAGQCTGECKPYTTRCAAGSTTALELCDATGHWGPGVTCAYICDTTVGKCAGECTLGGPAQCSGNSVRTCSSTGHWMVTTACTASTCSLGQCRPCTSGEHQCNNSKPQTCNSTGVWMDDQASACPYICEATTGKCAGECMPDADACADGQTSKHCKADGTYASIPCANICDQATGRCGGVCVPNSHRCNGGKAETCGTDGQWGAGVACATGCDTAMGQCAACTDDPLSTTCMGGKCGPTTNNCGRTVMCSALCAGVGESCGGGGVAGVCGCRPEPMIQTCQSGALCGGVMNNCGQAVACGDTCVAPQTCGGGTSPNSCGCTPKRAADACAGKNCDAVSDGCGGTVSCGSCTTPQTCGGGGAPNVCGCTPMKMTDVCGTRVCGTLPDGCGGNVTCGPTCASGLFCSNGMCVSSCTPMTTCPTGKNCGMLDNGCGTGMLTCGTMNGSCPSGQTCMGGVPGTPNVCGCTPLTMTAACAGKNCDTVSDGCGGTISCGSCTAPKTCGGGGAANMCGCTPKTKAQACTGGKNCGTVADGCGGNVDCGSCTAPQTCNGGGMANVCGCTPLTVTQACPAGQNCNTAPDGCGGSVSCGTCTGTGQTCGGGGTPNKCGCTPATSCGAGTNCGTKADGCGGTITCGTATCGTGSGQACGAVTANVCGCTRNSMAVTCSGKCGTVNDNCGTAVNCGTTNCSGAQVCAQAPASPSNVCCTPETDPQMCSRLVHGCGSLTAADNCGSSRTIASCGTCTAPQTCGGSGVCGCVAETDSAFCTRLGKTCGPVTATDNCGASRTVASCGTCGGGQVCEGPGAPSPNNCCTPQTDAQLCSTAGKNCGSMTVTDNCGSTRTVSCGTCTTPQTCAGGSPSVPNVCGCTAESNAAFCTRLNKNCGMVMANDNCGTSRTVSSCGTCTGTGQTCGGSGTANVCGCTPKTCPAGSNCGTMADGCGSTISCGNATCGTGTGQTCGAVMPNVCGCVAPCKQPLGGTCTVTSDCVSGFCTDGHCCGVSSCSSCRSCDSTGGCNTKITHKEDPDSTAGVSCVAPNICDGNGQCSSRYSDFTVMSSVAGQIVRPTEIIPGPDGRVWFTGGALMSTTGVGAANASIFGLSYAYYDSASDTEALAVGADGNVWIGQAVVYAANNANGFGRINTSGVFQSGISIDSLFPVSMTAGPAGSNSIWFMDLGSRSQPPNVGRVLTVSPFTRTAYQISANPFGSITLGPDGNIWYAPSDGAVIGRVIASGASLGTVNEFTVPNTTNAGCMAIVGGPDGGVWFTEARTNKIVRIATDTFMFREFVVPTPSSGPSHLVFTPDGALWFTENFSVSDGSGTFTRIAGAPARGKIGRLNISTGVFTEFTPSFSSSGAYPFGITYNPTDGLLWITEPDVATIGTFVY